MKSMIKDYRFRESVHGNDGIKNLAYQLIIQAVERLNCKLVLQEMPSNNHLPTIGLYKMTIMNLILPWLSTMLQLIFKRLRSFNSGKTKDSKVKLYGMDYNSILSSTQSSAMDIFDFITGLNKNRRFRKLINYPCC